MSEQDRIAREAQGENSFRQRLTDYLMDANRLPSIGKELAYAVEDIRQKVVEEGMYGRPVTPSIHGNPEQDKGDPLGRSLHVDISVEVSFKDRCREVYESREQNAPARETPGPER